MKHSKCKCRFCKQIGKVNLICRKYKLTDEEKDFMGALLMELENVGLDYEVDEAIFHGEWPGGMERLLGGLEKYKENPNNLDEDEK